MRSKRIEEKMITGIEIEGKGERKERKVKWKESVSRRK